MTTPKPFRLKAPLPLAENDVERACLDLLRLQGYWATRLHVGKFKTIDGRWITIGEKGLPDWIALHARRPGFLLEVKRPGGGLSADQIFKIQQLTLGYRLAVAVVESALELAHWLEARGVPVMPP
ncbi:MAG TPA: hypothetical protein VGG62_14975 [Terracidiphilus sp.]|jgi:hypothetical protein